jgi:hypothetical protein
MRRSLLAALALVLACTPAAANPLAPDVTVIVGDLTVTHATLSASDLRSAADTLRIWTSRFRTCYLNALVRTPALMGAFTFALAIRRDGTVNATAAKGMPARASDFARCTVTALSKLKLGIKADADATITIQVSPAPPPPPASKPTPRPTGK